MSIDRFLIGLDRTVARAIEEDLGSGDVSGELVAGATLARASILSRQAAVLCGRPWAEEVFRQIDPSIRSEWLVAEGERLRPGEVFCRLRGPARGLLGGERTALNFLQTLSATATSAARYAEAVAGTGARILDTRKTLPGLRLAQKYAVRCGGAVNHRIGLYDAYLIKENHIAAAGGISAAVGAARQAGNGLLVEVEVEDLGQLEQAMAAGASRVLLDNFDLALMRQAVRLAGGRVELEASGGISLDQVRAIAETGVDFISVGAITKDISAVDLSMRFEPEPETAA